jgi:hypothetical protein
MIVCRKIGSCFAGRFRFVNWLVFPAAGKTQERARKQTPSDSGKTENMALGWQHCLHRPFSDMSFVNVVARKFQTQSRLAKWSASGKA